MLLSALVIALMLTIGLLGYALTYSFYLDAAERAEVQERLRQVTQ